MKKRNRYQAMEQNMIYVLSAIFILFLLYLIVSALSILWLKIVLSVLIIPACVLCLVFLYLTNELLRPRSIWMTTAAGSILICHIVSLFLQFP